MTSTPSPKAVSVLVLGAGFGGLELSARLAEELGNAVEVTLIDRSDAFVFGFAKFDILFGKKPVDAVRMLYSTIASPHVRFRQETITAIDPAARRVTTDGGTYEADILVIALGADYDYAATPGLAESGNDFYSVPGAIRLREILPAFTSGTAIIGVCGPSFKCPPAPSEAAILLDEYLVERNVRQNTTIKVVMPFGIPVPPSPETSTALLARFAERGIEFVPGRRVTALENGAAVLDDGSKLPYDLFLGVPVHRAPAVVEESGLAENGWIPVNPQTLATRFPDVYAVGDVTSVGTAKAGSFAERAALVVADQLIAKLRGTPEPAGYDGTGVCYMEFGDGRVGKVDVDFFITPGKPAADFTEPSATTSAEKSAYSPTRRDRWFGSN
ncbi:MAG: FAD-dependent oxidoreductase [Tepidiformaceae bacterium]